MGVGVSPTAMYELQPAGYRHKTSNPSTGAKLLLIFMETICNICFILLNDHSLVMLYFSSVWSDERKELEKIVVQNGGQFSPCLTRKCTHLVANISFDDFWIYCFLFEISIGSTGTDLNKVPDLFGQTFDPPLCTPFHSHRAGNEI